MVSTQDRKFAIQKQIFPLFFDIQQIHRHFSTRRTVGFDSFDDAVADQRNLRGFVRRQRSEDEVDLLAGSKTVADPDTDTRVVGGLEGLLDVFQSIVAAVPNGRFRSSQTTTSCETGRFSFPSQ